MRAFLFACLGVATLCGGTATAATVSVLVRGADGRPLPGVVVTLDVPGVAAPTRRGGYIVEQRDVQFAPQMLIVPVGSSVAFPNRDKVRHHVYSFSKAKRFELKLYGRDDTRSVVFDHAGPVALGCNIHDQMSGVVFVTATPFAAATDAAGRATLDVPVSHAILHLWHPTIRAPGNTSAQPVVVTRQGLSLALTAK